GGRWVGWSPVPPPLEEDFLALDLPQFLHPLEESSPGAPAPRGLGRRTPESAYPIDFRGWLRIGRERRSEEPTRQRADERPPRGHWITSSVRAGTEGGIVSPQRLGRLEVDHRLDRGPCRRPRGSADPMHASLRRTPRSAAMGEQREPAVRCSVKFDAPDRRSPMTHRLLYDPVRPLEHCLGDRQPQRFCR